MVCAQGICSKLFLNALLVHYEPLLRVRVLQLETSFVHRKSWRKGEVSIVEMRRFWFSVLWLNH